MCYDVSRRSFLGACGAAGATVAIGDASLGLAGPPVPAAPRWVDRPMRWAQLTLVEDDPGRFDLFEFMTAVHKEVMTRYRVDGIFINRWSGSGMCFCEHCRTNFRAATGHELPRTDDPQDPARRAYILWEQQRLFELWRLWDANARQINPDSRVIPNTGGGATSPLDMKTIGELAPTLFADRQARNGLMPPWANGKAAKEYRAAMGRKPVRGIFSMGVEWDIDRIFWEVLAIDHGTLLRNAVRWATDEEPPVRVTGPGVLDVTAWRQAASMTVHLVNLTNPMMMKGPFRELIPVGEQQVVVTLPSGAVAGKVQLLVAGRDLPVEQVGTHLTVAVPSIRDHEVVAIDL